VVECTALEMRHRCKPIGGSNPSLSATPSKTASKISDPLIHKGFRIGCAAGTQMVYALGTPKRHPESGICWFRKRVPDRLKNSAGKTEIKFSLRTRDPIVVRMRNLQAIVEIERKWADYTIAVVDAHGRAVSHLECKSSPGTEVERPRPAVLERKPATRFDPEAEPVGLRVVFEAYATEAELAAAGGRA
jgi:hypothetical protein